MTWLRRIVPVLFVVLVSTGGAQTTLNTSHGRNYDEARVGPYELPDPLVGNDGRRVSDAKAWKRRRLEILNDFRDLMYGHTPVLPVDLRTETTQVRKDAVDGLATRKLITLRLFDDPEAPVIRLMLYVPNRANQPPPVFLGLSFNGNASVEEDPSIPLPRGWMRPHRGAGVVEENRATERLRGVSKSRWPLAAILERGFAVATFYYGDVEPDHIEGWRDGIRGYAAKLEGRTAPGEDEWGALGAWAWGLSRALDYLETDPSVDASRTAVFGHSRLGKAALWAGVQDERFALVVSNDSGEGGASLARRNFGENIAYSIGHASWRYNRKFPEFIGRADDLPFDQHMLMGLVAPRPLYVASASDDHLADPKGEFLSAVHAEGVYRLFGLTGLGVSEMPEPDHPVGRTVGYHVRTGGHDITSYDWEQYLKFAEGHLGELGRR